MRKKIFLADDSVTIQRVVELTFPEPEFEVMCASNGAQAIERIPGFMPDIALLDVVMPERNGYDVCSHIKKNPALMWMPVLLISGTFDSYDEKRASEAGAAGRLTKPFESRGLVSRVEELIAASPNPNRPVVMTQPATAMATPVPQHVAVAREQAAPEPMVGQTMRMATTELFAKVPAGPAQRMAAATPSPQPPPSARQPAPAPAPAPAEHAPAPVAIPAEMLERAVREAVSAISDKVIREVAWEVIPDIAEAIITRRIRELEEEAGRAR